MALAKFAAPTGVRKSFVLLCLWVLFLVLSAGGAYAGPVGEQQARDVVAGWLKLPGRGLGAALGWDIRDAETFRDEQGGAEYFVVYLQPNGFVIVPADDLIEPIIAFAPEGKYEASDENPLGTLVMRDLGGRMAAARGVAAGGKARPFEPTAQFPSAQEKWLHLRSGGTKGRGAKGTGSVSDTRVSPLVQSRWGQSTACGYYCYNYYTPNHYVCGCVATAMAQLMRYHQHPSAGVGTASFYIWVDDVYQMRSLRGGDGSGGPYTWSQMPYSPGCSTSSTQRKAIGALCHDAGVAAHMDYTSSGSGANMYEATEALVNTFDYSNAIYDSDWYGFDDDELDAMVNPNLDAGLPTLFGIISPSVGHAIVCDGYGYDSGTLYHHLNMGWSGSSDAWYDLPDIRNYYMVDDCIYNIYATGSGEVVSGRVLTMGGSPISGATVAAQRSGGGTYSTTSNSKGIYALAKLPSDSTYTFSVSKSGYCFRDRDIQVGREPTSRGNRWGVNFRGCPSSGLSSPANPFPSNGATGAGWDAMLKWNSWSEVGGGACATTYDVYFGSGSPPTTRIADDCDRETCDSTPTAGTALNPNTTYYWKVVGTDFCGDTATSPTWSFRTGGSSDLVDNSDPAGHARSGRWKTSSVMGGHYGGDYAYREAGTGVGVMRWTPYLDETEWYDVYTRWTAGSNRTSKAVYTVNYLGGNANVTVDQRKNGGKWASLGCYQFGAGFNDYVELSDRGDGRVIADAVMWTRSENGVIVDNKDAGFTEVSGVWPTSGKTGGYYGTNYAVHGAGSGSVARWSATMPSTFYYDIYARWTAGSNRSRKAVYTVYYDDGTKSQSVTVNQKAFGGQWVLLGTYWASGGKTMRVELAGSPLGVVVADAVMFQGRGASGAAMTIDNTDPEFDVQSGQWPTSSFAGGYYGANYAYCRPAAGTGKVRWTPTIGSPGYDTLYARWTAGSNRSGNVAYVVRHSSGTATVRVSQKKNGGIWWPLGVFHFAAGTGGYVEMSECPDGLAVADALRWVRITDDSGRIVDNTDPGYTVIAGTWPASTHSPGYYGANYAYHAPTTGFNLVSWRPSIGVEGVYGVYARWTAHKSRSRKAKFRVHHGRYISTVYLNQRGFGGEWVLLGNYYFYDGTSGYVDLSASPEGSVVADAIMWRLLMPWYFLAPSREKSAPTVASNEPPVAVAAFLTEAPSAGSPVVLSGSGSHDPDDGPQALAYKWTQLSGVQVKLDGADAAEARFTPTAPGVYAFELQVSDGDDVDTAPLAVKVRASQK